MEESAAENLLESRQQVLLLSGVASLRGVVVIVETLCFTLESRIHPHICQLTNPMSTFWHVKIGIVEWFRASSTLTL